MLCSAQPKDSIKVPDSIEIVNNIKKLDKVNHENQQLLKKSAKIEQERDNRFERLMTYIKNLLREKHSTDARQSARPFGYNDGKAVKPDEYETIEEPKENIEQKPKNFISRILSKIFNWKSKPKDSIR